MKRLAAAVLLALAACQAGQEGAPDAAANVPGDAGDTAPFSGLADEVVIRFAGTEPFWGGTITGNSLLWSTPENQPGETITVTRFAGRGGLTISGSIGGQTLDLALTPGACSDGMSDRTYPFAATVQLGAQQLNGCAWREGDDLGEAP